MYKYFSTFRENSTMQITSRKESLKLLQLKFKDKLKFRKNLFEFQKLNIQISEFNHTFS